MKISEFYALLPYSNKERTFGSESRLSSVNALSDIEFSAVVKRNNDSELYKLINAFGALLYNADRRCAMINQVENLGFIGV